MNSENVTALIEALSGLGDGAKEAFIWYVVMHYGSAIVITLITVSVIYKVISLITNTVRVYCAGEMLRLAAGVINQWSGAELDRALIVVTKNSKDINLGKR